MQAGFRPNSAKSISELQEQERVLVTRYRPLGPKTATMAMRKAEDLDELYVRFALGVNYYLSNVQLYIKRGSTLVRSLEIDDGNVRLDLSGRQRLPLDLLPLVSPAVEDAGGAAPGPGHRSSITQVRDLVLIPLLYKQKAVCLVVSRVAVTLSSELHAQLGALSDQAGLALAEMISRSEWARIAVTSLFAEVPALREGGVHRRAGSAGEKRESLPNNVIFTLLDDLEKEGDRAEKAKETLRALGEPAVKSLLDLFPGDTSRKRTTPLSELPPASRCSTVLLGLAAIGQPVLSHLEPLLKDRDPERRFFATHLLAELRSLEALPLLIERLGDKDRHIRRAALRILRRFAKSSQLGPAIKDLGEDLGKLLAGEVNRRAWLSPKKLRAMLQRHDEWLNVLEWQADCAR